MRLEAVLSAKICGLRIALDLRDLTPVDQGVVIFLGRCEANGIEMENSPAYIRSSGEARDRSNSPRNSERLQRHLATNTVFQSRKESAIVNSGTA
jgi:hypothetical protein